MNTKLIPVADAPLIPEMEIPPDALFGGPELLDDNEACDACMDWSFFSQRAISFFNLPLFYQLRARPYHEVLVTGRFDLRRLANDHRQHIYRSGVALTHDAKPAVENLLLCLGQGVFVMYEANHLSVIAPTPQAAAKAAAEFRRYLLPPTSDKPRFHLVSLTPNGPSAEPVQVDPRPSDAGEVALHYGAEFAAWEKLWLARLTERRSGVTLLFGPPGVGKTSYLKMLMARFIDRFIFYYLPLSSFDLLSAPQYVPFWLEQNRRHEGKAKMAIIEDAENLLLPRDERSRAQVSNLLNIGDGFLGEHLKLHVVATTNVPMRQLDEAVLRPGRLVGAHEFRRLTHTEARRLAQAKGLTLAGAADTWSLAEIYHGQPEAFSAETNVGFSARA